VSAVAIDVVPLDVAHEAGWAALFEACHCACYCRFWHFSGTTNAWLERCAFGADENRAEHGAALEAREPSARGLIAMVSSGPSQKSQSIEPEHVPVNGHGLGSLLPGRSTSLVVGWMKLVPRATVPKLRKGRVYGALDLGEDEGVYSIGCFLVHPDYRGRGVARALVIAADDVVRAWGGRAIEAYPRRSSEPLRDEEVWMGPERLYIDAGYTHVAGEAPYPVLRRELR